MFEVADPNSDAAVRLMMRLAPDLVVLGTTRILTPKLLAIPRLGVLNVHPGLLPQYRGVDVIAWALHNGDPLGVTVHFVDPGIDTGRIVAQRRLEMRQGDTLAGLKRRAGVLAAEMMADCVHRLIDTGSLQSRGQDPGVGRTYTRMPPKTLREVEAAVTAMARVRAAGE